MSYSLDYRLEVIRSVVEESFTSTDSEYTKFHVAASLDRKKEIFIAHVTMILNNKVHEIVDITFNKNGMVLFIDGRIAMWRLKDYECALHNRLKTF